MMPCGLPIGASDQSKEGAIVYSDSGGGYWLPAPYINRFLFSWWVGCYTCSIPPLQREECLCHRDGEPRLEPDQGCIRRPVHQLPADPEGRILRGQLPQRPIQ